MNFINWFLLLLAFCLPLSSQAKIFNNAYVSFELPDNWNCLLEDTEWVCRSSVPQYASEAVIILTAKEVGPLDSVTQYEQHLKTPKTITSRSGAPLRSQIVHVKPRLVSNQNWMDGLHLNSEIENYYTRYMATVKDRIGILVTFSAHKLKYTKYSNDFFRAIQSLNVIANPELMKNPALAPIRPGTEVLGAHVADHMSDMNYEPLPEIDPSGGSQTRQILMALAVIFVGAGVYIYLKSRRKQ